MRRALGAFGSGFRNAARAVDEAVPNEDGVPDAQLGPTAKHARWLGPIYAVFAVIMIPWTTYLGFVLPDHQLNSHYDVAWAGFDVGLILALAWTAWSALRRSTWLPIAATCSASMLVVDAWFDVVTSMAGSDRWISVLSAVFLELPTAVISAWLARGGQGIASRHFYLRFLRRRGRPDAAASAESLMRQSREGA